MLLTGADEATGQTLVNRLFPASAEPHDFEWPRLDDSYHGSGCTLASACATLLAQRRPMLDAVAEAQAFTHRALARADRVGKGQALPHRSP